MPLLKDETLTKIPGMMGNISFVPPLCISTHLLYLSSSSLSFFSKCRQLHWASPQTVVSGRRQTIEFWKWHGTRQRECGVASSPFVFLPIRAAWADCSLFHNSISRDHAAKQWKIHYTVFPHQQCLLSDLHLSFSNSHEYGIWIWANIWGYAKSNKRLICQPWNRLYRGSAWTNLDELEVLSSLGNFLTFILCSGP